MARPMITVLMDDSPDKPAREPLWLQRRLLLAGAALLAGVLVAAALAFLQVQQQALQQDALVRNELVVQALEDQANSCIAGVELALSTAAEALRLQAGNVSNGSNGSNANPTLYAADPVLARTAAALPFLRSISLVDAQGRVLASSNPANLVPVASRQRLLSVIAVPGLGAVQPGPDLADLNRATTPDTPAPAADTGAASRSPIGPSHLLPWVQPVSTGYQTDWLVAVIDPAYFRTRYTQLLGSGPQRAALLSLGGQLIAASPGVRQVVGQRIPGHRVFSEFLPGQGQGRFQGSGLDGEPAYGAFRSARLQPLVLLVETPQAALSALADPMVRNVALGLIGLLLLVGALTVLVWRSQRSREEVGVDLAAARDSIAAHDAFTDRLFQVSPIPMVVKDTHGRFLRVNKAWTDLTGLPYERVIGVNLGRLYPAQLAAPHMVQEQMAIASGQPTNYEEQILDSDGLPRDVMIRVMPYIDAEGQVAGVITCLTDVTEFREAALRTLEAKDAAEYANLAKSEFLANISHELRTPLQGILGFSELGSQRGRADGRPETRMDERAHGMFSDIHSAGERMLSLVNNLLDLSRLESTVGEVHLAPMDIVPALAAVVQELQPMAHKQRLRLLVGADNLVGPSAGTGNPGNPGSPHTATPAMRHAPLWAAADGFRLQQVLRNVLANAIRFAPAGTSIEIHWRQVSNRELMVSVRDHGPGIPGDELDRIFESFVQSSRTKDGSGGTGLGLAICRKIMTAHRGRISAHNHAEGGAVFEIVLAALTRASAAAAAASTSASASASAAASSAAPARAAAGHALR